MTRCPWLAQLLVALVFVGPVATLATAADPPATFLQMFAASKTELSIAAGTSLSSPLYARVYDYPAITPAVGTIVTFTTANGCGSFNGAASAAVAADSTGLVQTGFTAGSTAQDCKVLASTPGSGGTITVSFLLHIYEAATLRLTPSQRTPLAFVTDTFTGPLFTVTLTDAGQHPVMDAKIAFTSPSPACGLFGTDLEVDRTTDATGSAGVGDLHTGPAPTDCTITAQWLEGGLSASLDLSIIDASTVQVATSPTPLSVAAYGHVAFDIVLTSPGGLPLENVPVTFAWQPGAIGAHLDQVSAISDSRGHVSNGINGGTAPGTFQFTATFFGVAHSFDVAETTQNAPPVPPGVSGGRYQDMWWGGPDQNGWGFSLIQHGDTLFGVFYLYYADGSPTWLVMPGGNWDASHTIYSGNMYSPRGTPFYAYDASRFQIGNSGHNEGFFAITFVDDDHAILQLDTQYEGRVQRPIVRQKFGPPAEPMADHSDMWWGGQSQDGWGIAIIQQYRTLFIVWFTYDTQGIPRWYVVPSGSWTGADTWEGDLYRTTGTGMYIATGPYNPHDLQVIKVGTAKFTFSGDNGTLDYSVDGRTGSVPIMRQGF
jgi:hypothetical protein